MAKTSQKIKEKALEMFNDEGVEVVTTRHVASALGMSQGNLHYHFSGRNELISALYEDFKAELKMAQVFRGQEVVMRDLKRSIEGHFELMWRYRFLLRDREVVWRRLPRIRRESLVFIRRTKNRSRELLNRMEGSGLLDHFSGLQKEAFLDSQVAFLMGWIHTEKISRHKGNEFARYQAIVFMRMWTPMFLPKERQKWEELVLG